MADDAIGNLRWVLVRTALPTLRTTIEAEITRLEAPSVAVISDPVPGQQGLYRRTFA